MNDNWQYPKFISDKEEKYESMKKTICRGRNANS